MSQVAVAGAGASGGTLSTSSSSTTYYGDFGGVNFTRSRDSTESHSQWKNRGACTLQTLNVRTAANARTTSTALTSRHAGAAGNQAITIAAGATGVASDATHTDSLADGDLYNYAVALGASAQALAIASIGAQLSTSGQCFRQIGAGTGAQVGLINGPTAYVAFAGMPSTSGTTTEATTQIPALEGATLSNMQAMFTTSVGTLTVAFRKGGVTGNQTVSLPTNGATVEDTTHTDTVVAGNLFTSQWTWTSGSRSATLLALKYLGAVTNQAPLFTGGTASAGASSTLYWPLDGDISSNTTEANVQYALASGGTGNNLAVAITTNGIGSTQTLQFRKNAANGNQAVAITASTTGVFTDATHTDTCVTGDLVALQSPSTFTSSATIASFGLLLNTSAGGALTLIASQGAFVLTGEAATVLFGHKLVAAQGAFTFTGEASAFVHNYPLTAAQGSYALSGETAVLRAARQFSAAQGAFVLVSEAASLAWTHILTGSFGAYVLAGEAAGLHAGRALSASEGAFALTGETVTLRHSYHLTATNGAFVLTGETASVVAGRIVTAALGTFSLRGQIALPAYGRVFRPAQGAYSLSGETATLHFVRVVQAATGRYGLSGETISYTWQHILGAAPGSYNVVGQSTFGGRALKLTAAEGGYSLTGEPVTIRAARRLSPVSGAYVLSGSAAEFPGWFDLAPTDEAWNGVAPNPTVWTPGNITAATWTPVAPNPDPWTPVVPSTDDWE